MQDARKHRLHFRVVPCRDTCPAKLPESRSPAAAGRAIKRSVCRNGIGSIYDRACRFPGITPRRSSGMAGQSGVNISVYPANFSKPLYDTVPHKDSVSLEKYWNNQAIMLPSGLCIFGSKPARTSRVRAGLFRDFGAFVRKKLKVSATVLAFCMVNIHLCPEQNKEK